MSNKLTRNFIWFFLLMFIQLSFSQEIFVNLGKNFSTYKYSSSITKSDYIIAKKNQIFDDGNYYEVGFKFNKKNRVAVYQVGLTFNEYNLTYALDNTTIKYSWQTQYIGLENALLLTLFQSKYSSFMTDCEKGNMNKIRLNLKLGLNCSYLLSGHEDAGLINYDITNHEDYKKYVLSPVFGLNATHSISSVCNLTMGYNFILFPYSKQDVDNRQNLILTNNLFVGVNINLK